MYGARPPNRIAPTPATPAGGLVRMALASAPLPSRGVAVIDGALKGAALPSDERWRLEAAFLLIEDGGLRQPWRQQNQT